MTDKYILKDGVPVPEDDTLKWTAWYEKADRVLCLTHLPHDVWVSTVFLGIDHNHSGNGNPILWETMVFGGPFSGYSQRYSTKEEAIAGHEYSVKVAKGMVDLGE